MCLELPSFAWTTDLTGRQTKYQTGLMALACSVGSCSFPNLKSKRSRKMRDASTGEALSKLFQGLCMLYKTSFLENTFSFYQQVTSVSYPVRNDPKLYTIEPLLISTQRTTRNRYSHHAARPRKRNRFFRTPYCPIRLLEIFSRATVPHVCRNQVDHL